MCIAYAITLVELKIFYRERLSQKMSTTLWPPCEALAICVAVAWIRDKHLRLFPDKPEEMSILRIDFVTLIVYLKYKNFSSLTSFEKSRAASKPFLDYVCYIESGKISFAIKKMYNHVRCFADCIKEWIFPEKLHFRSISYLSTEKGSFYFSNFRDNEKENSIRNLQNSLLIKAEDLK